MSLTSAMELVAPLPRVTSRVVSRKWDSTDTPELSQACLARVIALLKFSHLSYPYRSLARVHTNTQHLESSVVCAIVLSSLDFACDFVAVHGCVLMLFHDHFRDSTKMVKANNCNGFEVLGALRPTGLSSSAFSTRYLMEHNANVATVGPANILRRRPEVNIYAAFRISKSVECVHYAFQK